jgi:hypothetical protein
MQDGRVGEDLMFEFLTLSQTPTGAGAGRGDGCHSGPGHDGPLLTLGPFAATTVVGLGLVGLEFSPYHRRPPIGVWSAHPPSGDLLTH